MTDTPQTTLAGHQDHRGPLRRFDAVLGGIIWWACHLGGSYWLIPRTCELGSAWPLHLLTAAMLVLIARAWLSGLQIMRAGRAARDEPGANRDVFLGWVGIAFSIFFAAVTVAEWVPVFFYDPCW